MRLFVEIVAIGDRYRASGLDTVVQKIQARRVIFYRFWNDFAWKSCCAGLMSYILASLVSIFDCGILFAIGVEDASACENPARFWCRVFWQLPWRRNGNSWSRRWHKMAQMIVIDSSCIMYAYSPSLTMITILCEPTGGEYHRACRGDPRPKAAMAMSGSALRFVCSLRCIKAFINADFAEIGHDSMLPSSIPCIIILVFSH